MKKIEIRILKTNTPPQHATKKAIHGFSPRKTK